MRRQLIAVCATLVLAASPIWAANGNINMFFDENASLCAQTVPDGGQTTIYVFAMLQGASQFGITGAEYKVQEGANNNADPGWFMNETFNPLATVIGAGAFTPMDNNLRGVNVAFPTCQIGDGTKVLLETVQVFNAGAGAAELLLKVVKSDFYSNQFFKCPLFVLCDEPVFTKVCLGSNIVACAQDAPPSPPPLTSQCSTSGTAYLNPTTAHANCTVAVQPTTWSGVKDLFR